MQIPHEGDSLRVNFTGGKLKKKHTILIFSHNAFYEITLSKLFSHTTFNLAWMLELTSMTELCDATASMATIPLQTYLTAVHYVQPFTDRPKTQRFRWQRHTVCAQCKYAFLITHNELDPMTSVSFEYWISHNRLQCPLMLDLARTVGDRAHM